MSRPGPGLLAQPTTPSTPPTGELPRVRLLKRELRTTEKAPDAPALARIFGKTAATALSWLVIWDASRSWPALAMVDLAEAGTGAITELSMRREGQLAPLLHAEHVELTLDGQALGVLLLRTLPHHTASLKLALSLMRQADRLVVMAGGSADHDWLRVLEHALPASGWQGPVWQVAVPVEASTRAARLRRHTWPAGVRVQAFDWPRAGRKHWNLDLLRRVLLEPIGVTFPNTPTGAPAGPDLESRVARPKPLRTAPHAESSKVQPRVDLPPLGPPDRLHKSACEQLIAVPGVRACAVLRLADAALLAQQGDADWLAAGAAETGRVARGWRQSNAATETSPDTLSWTHAQRQHLLLRLPEDGRDLALLALSDPATTDTAELRWMATVARNALA
ncbi:hypothetical protein [Sphaerotilus mobilis]|uniref:Uncharacterized protein n=1 Tax=Sphaerotilus mobilis TaxID=47994 RepID=A0A4Q7LPF7_9BURK|nr:hypothetical protein [Sphaerotilus mobilis]RZS56576.1 hypothetical protein EV685_1125 [Sphaerotilus mobilis]